MNKRNDFSAPAKSSQLLLLREWINMTLGPDPRLSKTSPSWISREEWRQAWPFLPLKQIDHLGDLATDLAKMCHGKNIASRSMLVEPMQEVGLGNTATEDF